MGGTLPVLARQLVGRVEDTQRQVANLYALNSFGAVLGAGLAGFITLPTLGVYGSLALASLLNLAAAGVDRGRWHGARQRRRRRRRPSRAVAAGGARPTRPFAVSRDAARHWR